MRDPSERPPTRDEGEASRAREAEAILRRVRQETDPQIGAGASRMITHARSHFSAGDADRDDPIEVLGTRIGRILALAVFLVLAFSLASYLLRG